MDGLEKLQGVPTALPSRNLLLITAARRELRSEGNLHSHLPERATFLLRIPSIARPLSPSKSGLRREKGLCVSCDENIWATTVAKVSNDTRDDEDQRYHEDRANPLRRPLV